MRYKPGNKPDKFAERNCIAVVAEWIFVVCMVVIFSAFCAWALLLSPEWMR